MSRVRLWIMLYLRTLPCHSAAGCLLAAREFCLGVATYDETAADLRDGPDRIGHDHLPAR